MPENLSDRQARIEGERRPQSYVLRSDGRLRVVLKERLGPPYDGWIVEAAFVTNATATEARLVDLHVMHRDGDDAPALTARLLREIHPERLRLRAVVSGFADALDALGRGPGRPAYKAVRSATTALEAPSGNTGGRPTQYSDFELAKYAQRYLDLVATPGIRSPVRALAVENELPPSTMRGLLSAARQRGLLESEGQGKAGGRLSAKARRALRKGEGA